jgi:mycofactocin glycosyltransferase
VRLVLDRSARVLADGTVVVGGRPARLLRLTPAGGRLVMAWRDGAAVAEAPAARRLAQQLIAAGLAHPMLEPAVAGATDEIAVVVPAHDRADLLAACLRSIGDAREVVVVDDGSRDPAAIAAVTEAAGARLVTRAHSAGPATARNDGIAATTAPWVAFVDSDVLPSPGWLATLAGHLADERLAAVAPRVVAPAGSGPLTAYEAVRSPLDLGAEPGLVGPGRRIGFVPAAALLVRRAAFTDVGGFDTALRVGEDVDLVWRLAERGWEVRYEPAVRVEHPHRARPRAWLSQRVAYGSSAGSLARRHPGAMRHLIIPRRSIGPWALAACGHPCAALLAAAGTTAAVGLRLPAPPGARRQTLAIAAEAQLRQARQVADAAWRAYPPLVAMAAVASPRLRRPLAAGMAVSIAADWITRRPRLDPVRFGALRAADDLAYATGVWLGCARARTLGPLVPQLVSGPRTGRTRRESVSVPVERVLGRIGDLVDRVLDR